MVKQCSDSHNYYLFLYFAYACRKYIDNKNIILEWHIFASKCHLQALFVNKFTIKGKANVTDVLVASYLHDELIL
jgi:hypothetical protein